MKFFKEFVDDIVVKWRKEKKVLLENYGLGGLVNRQYGDRAELFIQRNIENISPKYKAVITTGSQTPADIFAVSRRFGYWHIMLIQVKSSDIQRNIYELNEDEIKAFTIFVKFVKQEFNNFKHFDNYFDKPIIYSTGYAGVQRIESKVLLRHRLIKTKSFKMFKMNASKLDISKVKNDIILAHRL